ncbi:hypothetical protein [Sneathiella sp.]|uniref:hypothetical protein n=1 Tax=Sneathiella sp. TaxID=1964365 RepID=UPI0035673200
MTNLQKVFGGAKKRTVTKRTDFILSEERLLAAERALDSTPNNKVLRKVLADAFDLYQGMQSYWEQSPSNAVVREEAGKVLARIKRGADPLRVLNARPYTKPNLSDDPRDGTKATLMALTKIKLNSGVSEELLTQLRYQGIDSDNPNVEHLISALTDLKNALRPKTGRPEEYPRDGMLLQLIKIYETETGNEATYSSNIGRSEGPFMDLCRAMLSPANDFMTINALDIEQALKRHKKRLK